MFHEKKQILNLNRKRIGEKRNYNSQNIYIDRNERSLDFNNLFYRKFKKKIKHINRYPSLDGIYKKLSSFFKVNKKNIFITDGVAGGIRQLIEIFTKEKVSNIIYFEPSFALYEVYADLFLLKKNKILYDLSEDITFNLIKNRINKNTAIIFLPIPDNPISKYITKKDLNLLAKYCDRNKIILAIDEVYSDYSKYSFIKETLNYKYTVVLRSFSKSFGAAGIRFGMAISSEFVMNYLHNYRSAYEANSLSILFAETLLENISEKNNYVKQVNKSRKIIHNTLKSLNIKYYSSNHGNYVYVDMEDEIKKNNILMFLKKEKIFVRGSWKGRFKNGFSITITDIQTTNKFIKSLLKFYDNKR
tara:strand:+ start:156 stop:1232 length:1077 start_codon:yes stop_codon:yes gene_type:complete